MRFLIVDDEFICRKLLQVILSEHGECDTAVNGVEAVEAFQLAVDRNEPYDLICMDIMMPGMNGQEALERIRRLEKQIGVRQVDEVKVIMVTALGDPKSVIDAYYDGGATAYVVKPIEHRKLIEEIRKLGLDIGSAPIPGIA